METLTLAIIGTAGRGEDIKRLDARTYATMQREASDLVHTLDGEGIPVRLVSGGAAWADHLAVRLHRERVGHGLTLHLPCEFDRERHRFQDNGSVDWKTNPGGTLNYYHRKFSHALGLDTLAEIEQVLDQAEVVVTPGLFGRNAQVAKSDMVLAMTYGAGPIPKDGGTMATIKDYFKQCKKRQVLPATWHLDLNGGPTLYDAIVLPTPETTEPPAGGGAQLELM